MNFDNYINRLDNELYIINKNNDYVLPERYRHTVVEESLININNMSDVMRINLIPNIILSETIDTLMEGGVFGSSNLSIQQDSFYNSFIAYHEEDNVSIVCYDVVKECYCLFPIIGINESVSNNYAFIIGEERDIEIIELHPELMIDDIEEVEALLESFNIEPDGTMKIKIDKRKTFMSQYDEIKNSIKVNVDNRNYKALKNDLAYTFYLLNKIEEEYRSPSGNYNMEDVKKARMFTRNTFSATMKVVLNNEPDFDFMEYYKSLDIEEGGISITPDNITGLKKLLSAILV